MPNAIFKADFDQFLTETGKANTALRVFQDQSVQASTAIDKMATSGESWTSFLQKGSSLLSAFGVGLGVAELVRFGEGLADSASKLVDLSGKTGLSIDALQRFDVAGRQSGVTVNDFADAAFKLGVRLVGGSGSVKDAVTELGLSWAQLRTLRPDEQFAIVEKALEGMGSEQERNRLGVELFGKSFGTIAPAIADGYSKIAAAATVSSDAQIKAFDRAGDRAANFWANLKGSITSGIGNVLIASDQMLKLTKEQAIAFADLERSGGDTVKFLLDLAAKENQHDIELKKDIPTVVSFGAELAKAQAELAALTGEQRTNLAAGVEMGKTVDELTNAVGISEATLALFKEGLQKQKQAATEAAAAQKKFNEAVTEATSAGEGWAGTLDTINGEVVAAIRWYLDAGVAQDKLATLYGLTAAQVKSVATQLTDETAAFKLEQTAIEATTKLWDEYFALRVEHGGTATDKQIADIDRWYADQVAAAQKAGTDTVEFYDALEAVSHEKTQSVLVDWNAIGTTSRSVLQQAADKAEATFRFMLEHADQFTSDAILHFEDLSIAARKSADMWGMAFVDNAAKAKTAIDALTVVVGQGPTAPNAGAGRVSGNLAGTVVPPDILAAVAGMTSTSASLEVARMMKLRGLSFAGGGVVSGGTNGTDSVQAWLTPGEWVLSLDQVADLKRAVRGLPPEVRIAQEALAAFAADATMPGGFGSLPVVEQAFAAISAAISGGNRTSLVNALTTAQTSLRAFIADASQAAEFLQAGPSGTSGAAQMSGLAATVTAASVALTGSGANTGSGDGKIWLPNGSYYYEAGTAPWFDARDEEARQAHRAPDYKDYFTGKTYLRGFRNGGPVLEDGPIYAHKGEYVEPVGGGRGMIIHITNYITQPFGSPDAIGRAVGESTVQGLKNRGIRFPTGA